MYKTAIGQDSHRFEPEGSPKPLLLGGVRIPGCTGLAGNSDADVILHAITNAISSISGLNILGKIADELCLKEGVTDSSVYLSKALDSLTNYKVIHVSLSIECKRPNLETHIQNIKKSLAALLSLTPSDIGLTATTGEELTEFGKGNGIRVLALITVQKKGNK